MNKKSVSILGLGSLIAIILITLWLTSFLDSEKTIRDGDDQQPDRSLIQTPTESESEQNEQTNPKQPKKEFDLTRVSSNGQIMPDPEGVKITPISESEKNLLRSMTGSSEAMPGWESAEWLPEIPVFDGGKINSILKSSEEMGWLALIDNTSQGDIDNYAKKLNNNGWETEKIEDAEDGVYGISATKEKWGVMIIYNPEVSQTMISAAEGIEIQN